VAAPTSAVTPTFELLRLPCELLEAVLDLSPTRSLIALAPTCREILARVDDEARWRRKSLARFGPIFAALGPACALPSVLDKAAYFEMNVRYLARAAAAGLVLLKIDGRVYDATVWMEEHPGGAELVKAAAGGDATKAWRYVEHSAHAWRLLRSLARPDLELVPEGNLRHILTADESPPPRQAPTPDDSPASLGWGSWAWTRPGLRARLGGLAASSLDQVKEFLRPEMLLQSGDMVHVTSTRHTSILRMLGER
jgi:hypothetical protein